jgi:hypothetical protein
VYLNIGGETLLRKTDVIAVCDLDTASFAKTTRNYLSRAEKESKITSVADDLPKSFIVCADKIYLSQLSSAALLGRM